MKILFLGDIVGRLGRKIVAKLVPKLRKEYGLDLVIANVENAAHGSGVTENILKEFKDAKIDFYTSGDHALKNEKQFEVYEKYPILRPANFPPKVPGKGFKLIKVKNKNVLLINLIGRVFMKQTQDCPFRKLDEILANNNLPLKNVFAIIVDIHAEATSEKMCFKHFADGRVNAILGTHTHVATADEEITKKGTVYITDVGMCGYKNGSLGLEAKEFIKTFLTQIKYPYVVPEKGEAVLNGVLVELDKKGKGKSVKRICRVAKF